MANRYWLFKTEPGTFSIEDLGESPGRTTQWEGVRNYQARNMLRDEVKKGDGVLFYHSREEPMAVVGTAIVVRQGYPDETQFDERSKYFDAKAVRNDPRWYLVDIELDSVFQRPVTLREMREMESLEELVLLRKGSRLSIQPVTSREWNAIVKAGSKRA